MIPLKDQEAIRQKFAQELLAPVKVDYFTERDTAISVPGRQPCAYCKPTREMLQELAALHDGISLRVHIFDEAAEERAKFNVQRIPATVLRGPGGAPGTGRGDQFFTYYGMPGGTEFPSFLECIVDISRGEVLLSPESVKALEKLTDEVTVRVFVTPTCPYCPQMMRAAYQMALASPKVRAEVIEVNEFPELADRYGVRAVPLTVINDRVAIPGAVQEQALVEQVIKAAESPLAAPPPAAGAATPVEKEEPLRRGQQRDSGLFIP
ncbi:MAG: thioredoxin family protein [Dehalococcoidia bacterium]|nr:thioredoxin family protein [Dehalococcoidia bacterium]